MDVVGCREARVLAEVHFGGAALGDKRRTARLVHCAQRMFSRTKGSLNKKMGQWKDSLGLYRLLNHPRVTHEAILQTHRQAVLQRMRQTPVVLAIHDTSELDYTRRGPLREELGQIGNGGRRGLLMHNTLAVTPQRQVIGLVNQLLHKRREVKKKETPRQKRLHPQRESRLWVKGTEAMGSAPAGRLWVDVCDRGADTFEFLCYEQERQRHYLVRAAWDRNLKGEDEQAEAEHRTLHAYAQSLPPLGQRTVQVPPRRGPDGKKTQARTATVELRAGEVTLRPPHYPRGEHGDAPLKTWVVSVKEIDPPAGVQELSWLLLTNVPTETFQQACERVDWYTCRWMIEDFHKCLKSGLGIEQMQLQTRQRLEPAVAMLSVVGAVLLQLRELTRDDKSQTTPAGEIVPLLYVQVLSWRLHQQVREQMSVKEFLLGVARLGGHLGRKHDGPPGWQTLWQGWSELEQMVAGAEALAAMRCV